VRTAEHAHFFQTQRACLDQLLCRRVGNDRRESQW